jgi:hypothetical protein
MRFDLDSIWTVYLKQHTPIPAQDRTAIQKIGTEMDELLARSQHHAQVLSRISQAHTAVLEQRFRRVETGAPWGIHVQSGAWQADGEAVISDKQRDAFIRVVERRGGILRAAESATQGLTEIVPSERHSLSSKIASIASGSATEGDLSKGAVCSLAINMVVGGLLAAETGVGAFVGAAGCVILLAAEAAGNPC